jgi:iron only hydrogenase large subunit-like protein
VEYVLRRAARELFICNVPEKLDYKVIRNKDFKEVIVSVDSIPVLKFATAYGFKNIQNIIRNIKVKKCLYDYVEIMACPGGCLNGGKKLGYNLYLGGQIKPSDLGSDNPREVLQNLEIMIS